jgi:hypothetical protein
MGWLATPIFAKGGASATPMAKKEKEKRREKKRTVLALGVAELTLWPRVLAHWVVWPPLGRPREPPLFFNFFFKFIIFFFKNLLILNF